MFSLATRRNAIRHSSVLSRRAFTSIEAKYTAHAESKGSRAGGEGQAGPVSVKFEMPKELGGKGSAKEPLTTNPEELFALGYSACFLSAVNATYKQLFPKNKPLPPTTKLTIDAGLGAPVGGKGFALAVDIKLYHDSFKSVLPDKADAQKLLDAAHVMCPYSKATKGNIEHIVTLA